MISVLVTEFTAKAESSTVLDLAQQRAAIAAIDEDAQVASDDQVQAIVDDVPPEAIEITRINQDARDKALAASILLIAVRALIGVIPTRLLPTGRRAGRRAADGGGARTTAVVASDPGGGR
jgi:hypothetical protein